VTSLAALFLMGLFFLISGLLTTGSLERKGTRRVRGRPAAPAGRPLRRVHVAAVAALMYATREPILHEGSLWYWFMHMDPSSTTGRCGSRVLLLYSLGYAAWRTIRPALPTEDAATPRSVHRALVALGAAIAATSFVLRLWFPANSGQVVNLHLWEWPQCLGMFCLGVVSARHGWLTPVPARLARRCGVVALIAAASIPVMVPERRAARPGRERLLRRLRLARARHP